MKIDVPVLINYPSRTHSSHPPHYKTTYRLASFLTIPLVPFLLLFWLLTRADPTRVLHWQLLPNLYILLLLVSFFLPIRQLTQSGRTRFLSTFRRISIGGIAKAGDGKFGDILLADVLTSYSKVFGDLFIVLCMFTTRHITTAKPDRNCGGLVVVPILISLPSLIRLRQCLIEFMRVRNGLANGELDFRTAGWGGQHLANALKYSSAFPVIILSALQRGYDLTNIGMTQAGLFRLWLLFVFINSFYSFYWDVAKDWDLTLFTAIAHSATTRSKTSVLVEYPYGLRRNRYIHSSSIYYVVIGLDLLLRCTWSFKLSPHLDHFNDLEGGIFMMELLEVFRRWMWIFLRVETEWVRNNRGPAPDDILLGEATFH